ncbi:hypothetical protein [Sphingobium sp.]|uniref:hypothetical protein n=1 Tax=Sphingobium TaxID=165695 RepID=UPI001A1B76A3|nr:hypothetical protein [Sphingobium sp.]MBJ7376420.1 hypothetical protein [Sphingobium sp.]
MSVILMKPRDCGKTFTHQQTVQIGLLNTLFDRQEPMSVTELEMQIRCTRHDLWLAIRHQYLLGNIRKDQPITLTSSAHIAIAAGRLAGAMAVAV